MQRKCNLVFIDVRKVRLNELMHCGGMLLFCIFKDVTMFPVMLGKVSMPMLTAGSKLRNCFLAKLPRSRSQHYKYSDGFQLQQLKDNFRAPDSKIVDEQHFGRTVYHILFNICSPRTLLQRPCSAEF